ncbi:HpcH/HpaI aldolase/citrate lyase family protein [Diaphorobacter caeni]|uniref:HpcH/HpaI aldolase/citrate lyase family protein n=1 Tax=Diaphorobacter caeni TaxID=2784387 RepID=UPI00188F87CE|nr:CoA ester lyase [Diaphorobacter caeni]MBF5004862.1 CoA ester lyase [Diaphorobacter caeni]
MKKISRSFLFVPGDRPERFAKAAASGAHDIILDLEDAVSIDAKPRAREAVREWLGQGNSALVRINSAATPWFDEDLKMIAAVPNAAVMLPKADERSLAHVVSQLPGRRIVALIETVAAYLDLKAVCAVAGVEQLAFGSVDFSTESGIADEDHALDAVRTQIVLESVRAGMLPPIDGVSVNFSDAALIAQDTLRSRQLGFGAKLCIHPAQVAPVNGAFAPSAAEIDWAQRVLAAFEASGGAATAVDGKMIDKPLVDKARRIIIAAASV